MHCIEQDSLQRRRSVYGLGSRLPVADGCLLDTIEDCLRHCPTPFNVQSARLAVLLNEYHQIFWQMVDSELDKVTPAGKKMAAKQKIGDFQKAYGTILYFEDTAACKKLQRQFPLYKKNMPVWTQQANGMLQFLIWQTLAENDVGASLQHYNELIAQPLQKWLKLPKNWKLVAQMPFGSIDKEPAAKTFLPTADRLKIFR